jgi:exosortase/archaeosortase family protein
MRAMPHTGNIHGYTLLGFGFFLYVAGFLMESYYVGYGAMEFIYAGLVLLFLGWNSLRALLIPIAFLMFMWPYNFMEDVALDLRLHMSAMGHYILQFIAVPNMLDGTAIKSLPGANVPFAIFIAFDKMWQQVLIVALAVPLVLIGNLVRIVMLALGTIHFGQQFALGSNDHPSWFHEGAGYLVYFINFGGLIAAGSLLTQISSTPSSEDDASTKDDDDPDRSHA